MAPKSPGKPGCSTARGSQAAGTHGFLCAVCSTLSPVAGRWPFPLPPSPLAVSSRAFGVFPTRCRTRRRESPASLARSVSPSALKSLRRRSIAVHANAPDSLAAPVIRFLRRVSSSRYPSIGSALWSSTPGRSLRRLSDHRPIRATESVSFRPRGFSPPRRLSPTLRRRRCCSLLPILGFAAFRRRARRLPAARRRWLEPDAVLPATLSPLEGSPRQLRLPRSPPPPRRATAFTLGLALPTGLLLTLCRCRLQACSVLPWASVPPSVPGTQRSVGNPLLAPDCPGASAFLVGRAARMARPGPSRSVLSAPFHRGGPERVGALPTVEGI